MATRRPAVINAFAVLNFVVGGLGLVCGGFAALNVMATHAVLNSNRAYRADDAGRALLQHLSSQIPGWVYMEGARAAGVLLVSACLILSGVGLLLTQAWARALSIGLAVFSIILHAGYLLFQLALVYPVMREWHDQHAASGRIGNPDPGYQLGVLFGLVAAAAVGVGYGALLLWAMTQPRVQRVFAERDAEDMTDGEDEE